MTRFTPGHVAVRRYFRGPHVVWAKATAVVADDDRGLLLWLPTGADFGYRVLPNDEMVRTARSIEAYGAGSLLLSTWQRNSALLLHPPGAAHSVWWFFRDGAFTNWYVNLESPAERVPDGIDIVDHHLDIMVDADRTWRWKDEDEFAAAIDQPGFWTSEEARQIRTEGERAVEAIEAGRFPYDGTWCDFHPDSSWPAPRLPESRWRLPRGDRASI
jgi:predicted RNA-binding protein associated with RNAse of E/G family